MFQTANQLYTIIMLVYNNYPPVSSKFIELTGESSSKLIFDWGYAAFLHEENPRNDQPSDGSIKNSC